MANEKGIEPVGITLAIDSWTPCWVSIGMLGVNGGDMIDVSGLTNSEWKTKQPQALKEIPNIPFTALYKPTEFDAMEAEVNVNQQLTFTVPSVGSFSFWGSLLSFEANEAGVGEVWQGSGEIGVSNLNASGVEAGPQWTASP